MSLQRISVLVGIMVLAGCDSKDPFRPRLLADLTSDVTPPTLTAFDFSPKSINTSNGSATVTVHFVVTDDLSGATSIFLCFASPSGTTSLCNGKNFPATTSQTDSFDVTFPQYSAAGTWTLNDVYVQDAIGNYRYLFPADLSAVGFPTALTVANALPVTIDIQPGSSQNSIKLSKQGRVTLAILADAGFDALSRVVRSSLTFGHTGAELSLASCAKEGEDVNGDGYRDLVCQFYVQRTGFRVGDTQGILRGRMIDQVPIEGKDAVRILR